MKNLFAVNFAENTITASKTTLKKASVPNSPEYKALMKLMKQNPTFTIEEKKIKEATGKKTYEGLNKAFIEKYISIQSKVYPPPSSVCYNEKNERRAVYENG